jgi:AcrR family transcriptional regulator
VTDPTRVELPVSVKGRRSHAERTAETRAKIIRAVVESIASVGFQRTTAQEIAHRAGVTWGAVQHHFGGKDGILVAVLEDSFRHFAERIIGIPVEGTPLEQRVSLFIDRAWEHFSSERYRTTFEILLNYLGRQELDGQGAWREQMLGAFDAVWTRVFPDSRLPRRRSLMLQHYTVSVLSGLASTLMLQGGDARLPAKELALLKDTLERELGRSALRPAG